MFIILVLTNKLILSYLLCFLSLFVVKQKRARSAKLQADIRTRSQWTHLFYCLHELWKGKTMVKIHF